jgi:hypothetical protein
MRCPGVVRRGSGTEAKLLAWLLGRSAGIGLRQRTRARPLPGRLAQ